MTAPVWDLKALASAAPSRPEQAGLSIRAIKRSTTGAYFTSQK
jgi:hypothetical protein